MEISLLMLVVAAIYGVFTFAFVWFIARRYRLSFIKPMDADARLETDSEYHSKA